MPGVAKLMSDHCCRSIQAAVSLDGLKGLTQTAGQVIPRPLKPLCMIQQGMTAWSYKPDVLKSCKLVISALCTSLMYRWYWNYNCYPLVKPYTTGITSLASWGQILQTWKWAFPPLKLELHFEISVITCLDKRSNVNSMKTFGFVTLVFFCLIIFFLWGSKGSSLSPPAEKCRFLTPSLFGHDFGSRPISPSTTVTWHKNVFKEWGLDSQTLAKWYLYLASEFWHLLSKMLSLVTQRFSKIEGLKVMI